MQQVHLYYLANVFEELVSRVLYRQGMDQLEDRESSVKYEELRMVVRMVSHEMNLFRFRVYRNGFSSGQSGPYGKTGSSLRCSSLFFPIARN
jgi:hypothetical protein